MLRQNSSNGHIDQVMQLLLSSEPDQCESRSNTELAHKGLSAEPYTLPNTLFIWLKGLECSGHNVY